MACTLTAHEALDWYFKHRPRFVKSICSSVSLAPISYGVNRQIHAEYAHQAMAAPLRVYTFLLQQADHLSLDSTTRTALENDAPEMRAYTTRLHAFLETPWS